MESNLIDRWDDFSGFEEEREIEGSVVGDSDGPDKRLGDEEFEGGPDERWVGHYRGEVDEVLI